MERRLRPLLPELSIRLKEGQQSDPVIEGYAAVFFNQEDRGTEFELWEGVVERIAPQAFDRAMAERQDVVALFNHNPDHILGRRGAGTLNLSVDQVGLRYTIQLGASPLADNVRNAVARGDVAGSSFAFYATKETWEKEGTQDVRTIQDVDLVDVGPVVFPAYKSSTSTLGTRAAKDSHDTWMEARRLAQINRAIKVGQSLGLDV